MTNASLQQLHKDEEALGVAIQQAVEAGDAAKLTAAHAPWAEFYERHMKKEEASKKTRGPRRRGRRRRRRRRGRWNFKTNRWQ